MTLTDLIEDHRAALRSELTIGMTTSAVPPDLDATYVPAKPRTQSGGGDTGWTGMPFSVPFGKYLDQQYGELFPFSAALKALRRECRNGHLGHTDREEWTGALCHRLVVEVIHGRHSIPEVARDFGFTVADVERLLGGVWDERKGRWRGGALRIMQDHMNWRMALKSEKAEPEEYSPTRLSRAICDAVNREVRDFDLEQRIWEAMRHRDPSLPSWEDEWAKRQARIIEHRATCERCRLEEAA